jgi:hypothetical protein
VDANHHERKRYWRHWCNFIAPVRGVDPMLTDVCVDVRIDLLIAFAEWVRAGNAGKGHRVRCPTVQVALRAIGATFELAGKANPTYRSEGRYWLALERQLESFRRQDPPATPKLAVPVSLVNHINFVGLQSTDPKLRAASDLCLIAFYFLLRVGEYTSGDRNRRTTPFRACDVTFWDKCHNVIPNTSSLERLYTASSVTMRIGNQKNGIRGGTINHQALHSKHCPVRALARRVHSIMSHPKGKRTQILSTFFEKNSGTVKRVDAAYINRQLKQAVSATGLDRKGFRPENISSHSLRAGGAMAMHLNDISAHQIRKMGRWSSDTFLMYIHEQVAAFSAGISSKMAKEIGWQNIEGPSFVEDHSSD